LIEQFEKGVKPKDLVKKGYPKSTVYEAYRRFRAREEAKRTPIVEVFKRLEEGKSLPKIVVETGLDPEKVKEIYQKWLDLKKIDINQPTVLKDIEDLRNRINKLLNRFYIVKCPSCYSITLVS